MDHALAWHAVRDVLELDRAGDTAKLLHRLLASDATHEAKVIDEMWGEVGVFDGISAARCADHHHRRDHEHVAEGEEAGFAGECCDQAKGALKKASGGGAVGGKNA